MSFGHVVEMGQLARPRDVRLRAKVLDWFPVVRASDSSAMTVARLEIRNQLLSNLDRPTFSEQQLRELLFPRSDPRAIQRAAVKGHGLFQSMRSAYKEGAEAERLGKQGRMLSRGARVPTQMPNISKKQWEQAVEQLLQSIPEDAVGIRERVNALIENMSVPVREGDQFRDVMARMFGLTDLAVLNRVPDEDLSWVHVFMGMVREEVKWLTSETVWEAEANRLTSDFDPYGAPAMRLRLSVNRARKLHPKEPEPGDQVDEDHIMFAPYVDLYFTDRRVHSWVVQEAKRSHGLLLDRDVSNVRRARDLDDVLEQCRAPE